MAITTLTIKISNPGNATKARELELLVDSGAVYSVISAPILRELGIKPEEERKFILANGEVMKRKVGIGRFQYKEFRGGAPVIFGEKGDSLLLGATSLEAMGLVLNPLQRELMKLPMVLG